MTTTALPASFVTSWLPITTAWSAPAACSSLIWEGYPPWLAVNDPGYGIYVNSDLSCLPPAATQWWEQPKDLISSTQTGNTPLTTYLIGPITCPQAYTTATTTLLDSSSTFIACCPSDYSLSTILSNGNAGQCTSEITIGQKISLAVFTTSISAITASAWITTVSTVTSNTTVNGVQMNGWNIASQTSSPNTLLKGTSASTTTSAFSSAVTAGSATSTAGDADSTTRLSSTGKNTTPAVLSTKTKIGIGIGASLAFIVIVTVVLGGFWIGRRHKTKAPYGLVAAPPGQGYEYYSAEAKAAPQEMNSGFQGYEMHAPQPISELQ